MRTTIDGGGRIVVPKKVRDYLGLVAGSEVEIELDGTGGGFRVEVVASKSEIEEVDGVWVTKPSGQKLDWSAEELRDFIAAVRDKRL
jgi:AbrB family looped-hinge helix DNA binding protein